MSQKAMPAGRQGFSQIILLGIIAVLILAGASSFLVLRENKISPTSLSPSTLGSLCFDDKECNEFCKNNLERCKEYCRSNPENLLCQKSFSFEISAGNSEKVIVASPTKESLAEQPQPKTPIKTVEQPKPAEQPTQSTYSDLPSCGTEKGFFTTFPVSLSDLVFIRPLGFIGAAPEHIYPTDHVYFFLKRDSSGKPIEVPVYSPGDIWITKIKEIKMERPIPNSTDYSIFFSPCKEFEAFYFHLSTVSDKIKSEIKPPYKYCGKEGELGRFKSRDCEKEVHIKLSVGELMGTVGQLDWQASFDLGAYDLRTPSLDYANPSRWQKWQQHIVCPFDYFSEDIKTKLKAMLGEYDGKGNVLRTIEPICGEIEQDVQNTAQGVWFVKNAKTYARPELSLIHDFIDPSIGAFAFGFLPVESGLSPDVLHFNPKNSGFINRDFKDVTNDGNIYCYDNLIKQWSYDRKPETLIILVQLTSPTTLKIEGRGAASCGNGPWSFDTFAKFER